MYMPEHHTQKFPTYNSARYAYAIHLLSEAVENLRLMTQPVAKVGT